MLFGTEIVDLYVGPRGPRQKQFRIHKRLLCSKVPYFDDAMFSSGMLETQVNPSTFEEDCPAYFELWEQRVYTGTLPALGLIESMRLDQLVSARVKMSWRAAGFYKFLDKICLFDLMDLVMTKWINCWKCKPEIKTARPSFDTLSIIGGRCRLAQH